MKNFFPLIIILIVSSTICSSTEEKTKQNENSSILSSLITGATNFYSNYMISTVKYVTFPLGYKGCQIAPEIQIVSEVLKNSGIGKEASAKILEKVIENSSTEAIKEVAGKKAEEVVYKWGTKTSFHFLKLFLLFLRVIHFIMLILNSKMVIILVVHFM